MATRPPTPNDSNRSRRLSAMICLPRRFALGGLFGRLVRWLWLIVGRRARHASVPASHVGVATHAARPGRPTHSAHIRHGGPLLGFLAPLLSIFGVLAVHLWRFRTRDHRRRKLPTILSLAGVLLRGAR